jgi:outer membrane protein assembly factor BamB
MTSKGSIIMRLQSSLFVLTLLTWIPSAQAQFRGEWVTGGSDAQRSAWVRTDAKISPESMTKPGFTFLWKMKFANTPRQMNSLTAPILMNQLIGYKGFRSLAFVGGSADKVFVVDSDIARTQWERDLSAGASQPGTPECPGGMTTALARSTSAAIPAMTAGGGGPGRGSAAASAVGEPGEGAVTLAQYMQRRAALPATPPPQPAAPKPVLEDRRGGVPVYAITGDGRLHRLNVDNGADIQPAAKFLPPNANAVGLIVVENYAYAVTSPACGGAPSGVWMMNVGTKETKNWESKTAIAGTAGAALGGDGSLYVATKGGELVHLEARTLKPLATYTAQGQEFTSSPVVFEHKGKILVAAATKDGQVHIVDGAGMQKAMESSAKVDGAQGALATWQDEAGVRWLLTPSAKNVVALKLTDKVESGWVSRDIPGALQPMIVNGVVFAASSGKSTPGMLYALDGKTGKELWNSGKTITSPVNGGGLAGALGQVYLPTYDGTLYAFGFPIEH